jgi:hypothetical protein
MLSNPISLRNKSSIILYHLVLTNPAKKPKPNPKPPLAGIPPPPELEPHHLRKPSGRMKGVSSVQNDI